MQHVYHTRSLSEVGSKILSIFVQLHYVEIAAQMFGARTSELMFFVCLFCCCFLFNNMNAKKVQCSA